MWFQFYQLKCQPAPFMIVTSCPCVWLNVENHWIEVSLLSEKFVILPSQSSCCRRFVILLFVFYYWLEERWWLLSNPGFIAFGILVDLSVVFAKVCFLLIMQPFCGWNMTYMFLVLNIWYFLRDKVSLNSWQDQSKHITFWFAIVSSKGTRHQLLNRNLQKLKNTLEILLLLWVQFFCSRFYGWNWEIQSDSSCAVAVHKIVRQKV